MGTIKGEQPRILFYDIESTNLNATFGTILCIGYKWLDEKTVHIPTILDHRGKGMLDDSGLVKHFSEIWNKSDIACGHYSRRFDLPMISSKLMKYGLPPLAPIPHIDTWWVAKREFKMHSNRLGVLAEFLGCKHSKTPLTFDHWLHAALGDKKALKYIVDHCEADVLVLQEVFLKMRPWVREEPARQLYVSDSAKRPTCVSCGSSALQANGYRVARTRKYRRWHCQACGKWSQSRISVSGENIEKTGV